MQLTILHIDNMKYPKRFAVMICLLAIQAMACTYTFAQLNVGVKAGWIHSWMNVTSDEYEDDYDNFCGGLAFSYKINESFSVRADLLYSKRGYEVDDGAISDSGKLVDVDVSFDYLNVPIVFEYFPLKYLYLQAGPQIDVQIGRNLYYDNKKMADSLFGKKQWLGAGAVVGVGATYKNLFIELQYYRGFVGAFNESKDNFKAKTLSLSVGIFMLN